MLRKFHLTACCLVWLATVHAACAQDDVQVLVNRLGDITIKGTPGDDSLLVDATPTGVRITKFGRGDLSQLLGIGTVATVEWDTPRNIRFDLGDGDDAIKVAASAISIRGNLGRGNDMCHIGPVIESGEYFIQRDVIIDGGPGVYDDAVVMRRTVVGGSVRINVGAGIGGGFNGSILTTIFGSFDETVAISDCRILRTLSINQNSGPCKVNLSGTTVASSTRVVLGTGHDEFTANTVPIAVATSYSASVSGDGNNLGSLYVNLGSGEDAQPQLAAVLNSTLSSSLTMIGGTGNDEMTVAFVEGNGRLSNCTLNSGGGEDSIEVALCEFTGNLSVNSSSGLDYVSVLDSSFTGNATINTGSDQDELSVRGLVEARRFLANLGSGDDLVNANADIPTVSDSVRFLGSVGSDSFVSAPEPGWLLIGFEN